MLVCKVDINQAVVFFPNTFLAILISKVSSHVSNYFCSKSFKVSSLFQISFKLLLFQKVLQTLMHIKSWNIYNTWIHSH